MATSKGVGEVNMHVTYTAQNLKACVPNTCLTHFQDMCPAGQSGPLVLDFTSKDQDLWRGSF